MILSFDSFFLGQAIIRDLQSLGWAGHHFELVRTDKPLRTFDALMERIRILCK